MSAEEDAYQAALEIIAKARETGAREVNFDTSACQALRRIPPELGDLPGLERVNLHGTQITDLAPLSALTGLQRLWLDGTQITDLAPLSALSRLRSLRLGGSQVVDLRPIRDLSLTDSGRSVFGLHFSDTPATRMDAELARLAKIYDVEKRTRDTLAYLNALPPWPEPYTPNARPDGKLPEPIGGGEAPPNLPPARPAPLRVQEVDGMLRRESGESTLSENGQALAQQGWLALRDFFADLSTLRPRLHNLMPSMERALKRFETALDANFASMNAIALGIHGSRIVRLSGVMDQELSDEDAGELIEFSAAIIQFLERFDDWRAYRDAGLANPLSPDRVAKALPQITEVIEDLFDRDQIADEIPEILSAQAEASKDQPEDPIAARGLTDSLTNVLSALARTAIKAGKFVLNEVTGFPKLVLEKGKGLAATSLALSALEIFANKAAVLRGLAEAMPDKFGWLLSVLRYLGL